MAETGGQEKTEQPTSKKLKEGREKGQVAKSLEINSLAIFASGFVLLYFARSFIGSNISDMTITIFNSLDVLDLNYGLMRLYAGKAFVFYLVTLSPLFIGLVLISLFAGYGQVGFKLSPKALQPKLSNLNPVNGLKNKIFSSRSFFELIKSIFKLLVIGIFTYWMLSDLMLNSIGLVDFSVVEILRFMVETSFDFIWKIAIVYAVLAIFDFIFQKHKFKKDMMMTRQEVKDENKQTEGDPQVKSKIRGKQISIARSRMLHEVPKADVVITNPTHYAVALKYEIGKQNAPKVIAKGVDLIAQRIKKIAAENNIPMHEDVMLARALYKACDIGDEIPEKLFKAVAQILAYIYQLKNGKKKKSIV